MAEIDPRIKLKLEKHKRHWFWIIWNEWFFELMTFESWVSKSRCCTVTPPVVWNNSIQFDRVNEDKVTDKIKMDFIRNIINGVTNSVSAMSKYNTQMSKTNAIRIANIRKEMDEFRVLNFRPELRSTVKLETDCNVMDRLITTVIQFTKTMIQNVISIGGKWTGIEWTDNQKDQIRNEHDLLEHQATERPRKSFFRCWTDRLFTSHYWTTRMVAFLLCSPMMFAILYKTIGCRYSICFPSLDVMKNHFPAMDDLDNEFPSLDGLALCSI